MMHGNKDENGWFELKGKAKRQWDKVNNKSFDKPNLDRYEEDIYSTKKDKKHRPDKHSRDMRDI
ncbi:MAG: hypothetical protein V4570_09045 [Pseudomonadota bacterium]